MKTVQKFAIWSPRNCQILWQLSPWSC